MAKKKKGALIRLVSSAGTGIFYVARSNGTTAINLRKYDKKIRKHVMFKETKMK